MLYVICFFCRSRPQTSLERGLLKHWSLGMASLHHTPSRKKSRWSKDVTRNHLDLKTLGHQYSFCWPALVNTYGNITWLMCVQPPLGTIFSLLATSFPCHILGMRLGSKQPQHGTLDLRLVSLQLWMWAWLPWRALNSPCWQECWCSCYSPAELKPSCCPARGSNMHELHFHTGFKKV